MPGVAGTSSWSFNAQGLQAHRCFWNLCVIHAEEMAGQSESFVWNDVVKFDCATPSQDLLVGDVIGVADPQNPAKTSLLKDVELSVDTGQHLPSLAGISGSWDHDRIKQAEFDLEGDGWGGSDLVHPPKYLSCLSNAAFDIHLRITVMGNQATEGGEFLHFF